MSGDVHPNPGPFDAVLTSTPIGIRPKCGPLEINPVIKKKLSFSGSETSLIEPCTWQLDEITIQSLTLKNFILSKSRGDGHCLIYSVISCMEILARQFEAITAISYAELLSNIKTHAMNEFEFYNVFFGKGRRLFEQELFQYVTLKKYDVDIVDLMPVMLANLLHVRIAILSINNATKDSSTQIISPTLHQSTNDQIHTIFVKFTYNSKLSGFNHYDGLFPIYTSLPRYEEPLTSENKTNEDSLQEFKVDVSICGKPVSRDFTPKQKLSSSKDKCSNCGSKLQPTTNPYQLLCVVCGRPSPSPVKNLPVHPERGISSNSNYAQRRKSHTHVQQTTLRQSVFCNRNCKNVVPKPCFSNVHKYDRKFLLDIREKISTGSASHFGLKENVLKTIRELNLTRRGHRAGKHLQTLKAQKSGLGGAVMSSLSSPLAGASSTPSSSLMSAFTTPASHNTDHKPVLDLKSNFTVDPLSTVGHDIQLPEKKVYVTRNNSPVLSQTSHTETDDSEECDMFKCFTAKGLHFIHINAQSLLPKIDEVNLLSIKTNASVICISETWLDKSVSDSEVAVNGYNIMRNDRNRNGGGV